MKLSITNYAGIIICAVCLGVLTGISVSPVIQSVMTGLITVIVAMLSIAAGINDNATVPASGILGKAKVANIIPVAFFILFFTAGSFAGIRMRTANMLGDNTQRDMAYLTYIGFSTDEVKEIMRKKYVERAANPALQPIEATILFSYLSNEKVDLIRLKTGKALETELIAMDDPAINSFLRVTNDSLCLEALKAFLCTKK